ncbi:MAG TPA: GNAT family N-acetyltransferase [Streptosporangiaceae bacterium]|nr:GNAT family N-acetyltransferase [Streptosporangiaceae bacterium]
MPWVVRDVVDEINRAVGRRWQGLDRLLPPRAELPEGCAAPFVATGANGRPAGLAACRHEHVKSGTLSQTWGTAGRFSLIARLREPDTSAALDDLMKQWRDHLADLPGTGADDTAAMITWPARDVSGVTTLLRHGLQPITVIAARPARPGAAAPRPAGDASLVIREAGPADLDVVTELEMGVIRYDALFGAAILRPATEELVRAETQVALAVRPARAWLAERDGEPVGLVHVQPPEESRWITGMTRAGVTVYLQTMFVRPGDRGSGVGEALVRHVHAALDARGVDTTLLHYAQLNPLSAPFWSRMGYRPLWTGWEVRPAASLR